MDVIIAACGWPKQKRYRRDRELDITILISNALCRIMKQRGSYGIGIYHPKTTENLGTLWRRVDATSGGDGPSPDEWDRED
jgi:hypothetical protein